MFFLYSCDNFFLSELDDCGVPGGNNLCVDCSGVPNGESVEDDCGICVGGDSPIQEPGTTLDCFGNCPDCADTLDGCIGDTGHYVSSDINCCFEDEKDECGICNGDNSSCTGCMIVGADNYSANHTIPDNESCFVDYSSTIQPIFDNNCIECHGSFGGLDLSSYQSLMIGGDNGASVIPNDAMGSILIEKINPNPTFGDQMGNLSQSTINKISAWINLGALESN